MAPAVQSVLVVALIAVIAPWAVFRLKLRIPVAVVEIILGAILGHSGFHLVHSSAVLRFLSLFGLSYIMFLSGLELDLDRLFGRSTGVLSTTVQRFWVVIALWMGLGLVWGKVFLSIGMVHAGWATGIMLASSAPTVLLPALKEKGWIARPFGQWALSVGMVVDFISLMAITVLVAVRHSGNPWHVGLAIALFIPLAIVRKTSPWLRRLWFGIGSESVTGQIGVRGALAIITLFIALAQTLGTVSVLGAFLAGAVVAVIIGSEHEVLETKLEAIGFGYFIPFFFVTLGSGLQLGMASALGHLWLLIGLFFIAIVSISVVIALAVRSQLGARDSWAAASLFGTRLSVTVAGSSILFQAGMISGTLLLAMVIVSIFSSILFPLFFDRLKAPVDMDPSSILLWGREQFVAPLARRLRVMESGVIVVRDMAEVKAMPDTVLQSVAVAFIASGDPRTNEQYAEWLHAKSQSERIIVETSLDHRQAIKELGYIPFVSSLAPIEYLETLIRLPFSNEWLHSRDLPLHELTVTNAQAVGKNLRDLNLPQDTLIVAITRAHEQIIPRGTTTLEVGDVVTVWAPPMRLVGLRHVFQKIIL